MRLEPFSAGYWLAPDIEVTTYGGKHAIIQDDLFYELIGLTEQVRVVGSTGGRHFSLHPERSIPSGVVAVPRDSKYASRDGDALLIAKQNGREMFCNE